MNAYDELKEELKDGETVEAIVFGAFGWGAWESGSTELGYNEADPPSIPFDKRGVCLSLNEAASYMKSWSFNGGYGAPRCYAVTIWTTQRILYVVQYDGSTSLQSMPLHPVDYVPGMPGG